MPDSFCNRCGERRSERLSRFRIVESRDSCPDEVIYWITLCDDCLGRRDDGEGEDDNEVEKRKREVLDSILVPVLLVITALWGLYYLLVNWR